MKVRQGEKRSGRKGKGAAVMLTAAPCAPYKYACDICGRAAARRASLTQIDQDRLAHVMGGAVAVAVQRLGEPVVCGVQPPHA